jgi:hypothetical protein
MLSGISGMSVLPPPHSIPNWVETFPEKVVICEFNVKENYRIKAPFLLVTRIDDLPELFL